MNHPQPVSIKCPRCNLTNFATAEYCKRCKSPLQNTATAPMNRVVPPGYQGEGNTININISLPQTPGSGHAQPNINVNGMPSHDAGRAAQLQYPQQPPYQPQAAHPVQPFYQQRPPYPQQAHLPPAPADNRSTPRQAGEYELLNQTGFKQWQQMNDKPQPAPAPVPVLYAPQGYIPQGFGTMPHPSQRVYRRSDELMMHEIGSLPAYCVKCNADASPYAGGEFVKQKFSWANPLIWIAILSPLIFVILRLALSKRATVHLPLCRTHMESRNTTKGFLIGGGIAATVLIFFLASAGSPGWAFLLFLVALISLALTHQYSYQPLQAAKIDSEFVYLKGASREYLSRLPYC